MSGISYGTKQLNKTICRQRHSKRSIPIWTPSHFLRSIRMSFDAASKQLEPAVNIDRIHTDNKEPEQLVAKHSSNKTTTDCT